MTLFNQLVPRLSRAISRRENTDGSNAANDAEYTIKPLYELKETEDAWGLTVQLPGVAKDGLELSVEDSVLSIRGRRVWQKPEGWTQLYRESVDAPFALALEHDNSVDVDKIHAELKDGVLRVSLPKAEAVKPRKIAVS
ncbi:MAG TPA: Hsp20/alpha crystallin family protein [Acidobacteriota bacterium]|nr:Hsp20/alpha crystallin family protein [Acidobacteriota bacterium]